MPERFLSESEEEAAAAHAHIYNLGMTDSSVRKGNFSSLRMKGRRIVLAGDPDRASQERDQLHNMWGQRSKATTRKIILSKMQKNASQRTYTAKDEPSFMRGQRKAERRARAHVEAKTLQDQYMKHSRGGLVKRNELSSAA